jgi:hypothetical protein
MVSMWQDDAAKRQPIMWEGEPGIGKSDAVRQAARALSLLVTDFRASFYDPLDIKGVPTVNLEDRTTSFNPTAMWPRQGCGTKGVIFADEVGQAAHATQAALMQPSLDWQLDQIQLSTDWHMVAATNRVKDRAGVQAMLSAFRQRFCCITMTPDTTGWLDRWSIEHNIVPEVRSFGRARSSLLQAFDPAKQSPTLRSWSKVSLIFKSVPDDLRFETFGGLVGEGAAAEFIGFLKIHEKLPLAMDVLREATTFPLPTEPDVLYALSASIADLARTADGELFDRMTQVSTRMPREFGVLTMRDCVKALPFDHTEAIRRPLAAQWLRDHGDVLL